MRHGRFIPDGPVKFDRHTVRRLLRYLKPYKIQIITALLFLVGFSLLQLAGPYLVKKAIDGPIADRDFDGLVTISLLYIGTIIGSFICIFIQIYLMAWTGQHVMYDIRVRLYRHIQKLSLHYFHKNPVGRLITRLTSDIETLNELLSSGVVQIIGDLLTLIGILIILFLLNVKLALVTMISFGLLTGFTLVFRVKFRDSFRRVRAKISALNAFLQEHIAGMHVIQLFNHQLNTFDQFKKANGDTLDAHLKTVFYFSLFVPIVEMTNALSVILILLFSGLLVPEGTITIGVMVAFLQYAQRFFRPLRDLSQKYNILQAAIASSERVFGVLDETDIIPDPVETKQFENVKGRIEFDGVWFAYENEEWVLENVSFIIEPGEHIAIVGATGAGKTTMINLICRFYHPQKGVIRLDGVDIRDIPKQTLRDHIGLIQQDAFIFSGTVGENIALGRPEFDEHRMQALFEKIKLDNFINRLPLGLDEEVGERGNRFSAGEKQLISFARAISYDPKILILDEATSNIDTDTEMIIQNSTEEMIRKRTAILIAHRLSTIRRAHRILVFHKGKLREKGRHGELLDKNGIYARLYALYYAKNV